MSEGLRVVGVSGPVGAGKSLVLSHLVVDTDFASAIRADSSAEGSPAMPKNFFTNDPRWSNARM